MPNHVKNIISINGSKNDIKNVVKSILVDEDYILYMEERNKNLDKDFQLTSPKINGFTFNKIIPTPTNIFEGNLSFEDEEKYGYENCWYRWNINNWGTKWDCYDVFSDFGETWITIEFLTAWCMPKPIIDAIVKIVADNHCTMSYSYADEDFGGNMGNCSVYSNGESSWVSYDENKSHYEEVWGYCFDDDDSDCFVD